MTYLPYRPPVPTKQWIGTAANPVAELTPGAIVITGQNLDVVRTSELTPGAVVLTGQTLTVVTTTPVSLAFPRRDRLSLVAL